MSLHVCNFRLKIDIVLISLMVMLLARLPSKGQSPSATFQPPPGTYTTSWIGNSFGGNGGSNGFGYWVQAGADEIKVTPEGTVFAGVGWDEAGRCIGLYKDGRVNRILLKENNGKGKETAWGWGTANNALAVEGESIYAANLGKKLLHFRWKPGIWTPSSLKPRPICPVKRSGFTSVTAFWPSSARTASSCVMPPI